MIINSFCEKKLKILIDENDLKKEKIPLSEWLSSSHKAKIYIKNLIKNFSILSENFSIKDYSIFTYNYKVFLIIISI